MYRELQPFREALSCELKASLFPAVAGVDPNKLLETYLDRLTMYTGVDVADQTFTALALDASREILGSLEGCPNEPAGFERFTAWARDLRDRHGLRILAVASETTGIYYWALWDFLGEQADVARVLYEALSREIAPDYVRRLLTAFSSAEPEQPEPTRSQVSEAELIEPLSERELEVLELIAQGLTNREIATRLFLSLNTVKAHTRNIYGKLDVHNRTQAVTMARALGILPST